MIAIYDFEDGLQQVLHYAIDLPTKVRYWDRKGFLSDIDAFEQKNIVISSKPFDCLQRGVNRGKYNDDDERSIQDWSRRNWRYSNPEIYDHINNIMDNMGEDVLIIHPNDFINGELRKKIKSYIGADLKLSDKKLKQVYNENVNLK